MHFLCIVPSTEISYICLFALKPLIFKGFSVSVDNGVLYGAFFEPLLHQNNRTANPAADGSECMDFFDCILL